MKGSDESVVGGLAAERGKSTDVGQAIGYGTADLGENLHIVLSAKIANVKILRTGTKFPEPSG